MKQSELNRAVAAVTGETVGAVRRLGFSLLRLIPIEREPHLVDWDDLYAERNCAVRPVRNPKSRVQRVRRRSSGARTSR